MATLATFLCRLSHLRNMRTYQRCLQRWFHSQQSKPKPSRNRLILKTFAVGYAFGLGVAWFMWRRRNKDSSDVDDNLVCNFGKKRLVNVKGFWIPEILMKDRKIMEAIPDLKLGDSDIVVCSFPKSGKKKRK